MAGLGNCAAVVSGGWSTTRASSATIFSADTSKPEHGAFMQHVQERQTEIALVLLFFELELMAAKPEVIDPILEDESLANYRHFVHASRLFREQRRARGSVARRPRRHVDAEARRDPRRGQPPVLAAALARVALDRHEREGERRAQRYTAFIAGAG